MKCSGNVEMSTFQTLTFVVKEFQVILPGKKAQIDPVLKACVILSWVPKQSLLNEV